MSIIRGTLQLMAAADIEAMIDPVRLSKIRETDPKPMILAMGIGHEGESRPANIVGSGRSVLRYLKGAVQNLYRRLMLGTKTLAAPHKSTNDTDDEPGIGEIVGKALNWRDGIPCVDAAIYVYPQFRERTFDVASLEADFIGERENTGTVRVDDFERITAVRIGDSRQFTPAMPGATLLGAMQNFAPEDHSMTVEEIKAAIKNGELKVTPTDLFDVDELTKVDAVKQKIDQSFNAGAKRVRDNELSDLNSEIAAERKRADDLQTKLSEASTAVLQAKVTPTFDAVSADRKFDKRQQAFYRREVNRGFEVPSDAKDEASVKTAMNKFIDSLKDDWTALFGDGETDTPGDEKVATPARTGESVDGNKYADEM